MKLLVLSNGHGEDQIAVRIVKQLQNVTNQLELTALPIVGRGYAYRQLEIPLAGRVQQMPSGGFIYMGGNPLWQDVRGGLIQLTIEQIKLVRQWGKSWGQNGGAILAVGDIVPLLFAWLSGVNYAFVGTAKSEYYLRNETGWLAQTSWLERQLGSVYLPWERWLMSRDRCQGVFPRDSLTTEILKQWSIPAYDLGNPMMDAIASNSNTIDINIASDSLNLVLLPGSRIPEALRNWQQILEGVNSTIATLAPKPLQFLGAIAPALSLEPFIEEATKRGWQLEYQESTTLLIQHNCRLVLSLNNFEQFIHQADLAIAMAGTGTEEFVGLGKPAIIMPGQGPQFTYAFAEAQSRLLGCSTTLVETPSEVGNAIAKIINNPELKAQIALNGKRRMGNSGASYRIAQCIAENLF